jgi:hypothetical protein
MKMNPFDSGIVDYQSQGLLSFLQSEFEAGEPRFEDIDIGGIFAVYNGRERWVGICFISKHHSFIAKSNCLYIIFGENRNSDNLVVQHWYGPSSFNPPTIPDISGYSYFDNRKFFNCEDFQNAKNHIADLVSAFYSYKHADSKHVSD